MRRFEGRGCAQILDSLTPVACRGKQQSEVQVRFEELWFDGNGLLVSLYRLRLAAGQRIEHAKVKPAAVVIGAGRRCRTKKLLSAGVIFFVEGFFCFDDIGWNRVGRSFRHAMMANSGLGLGADDASLRPRC